MVSESMRSFLAQVHAASHHPKIPCCSLVASTSLHHFRAQRGLGPARHARTTTHQAAKMDKLDHAERTAHEPRDPLLHKAILAQVHEVNSTIRTFRLDIPSSAGAVRFLPGQWLDVFVPGIAKPGGFTITSPPSKARPASASAAAADAAGPPAPTTSPYLELAVQKSPENVVAQWLWQPVEAILSSELHIRVGGSFVWPPPGVVPMTLRKLVFIAGGVGINPLMSIVSHLAESPNPRYTVDFLYSLRDSGERAPEKILFLSRLAEIFGANGRQGKLTGELKLFLTSGGKDSGEVDDGKIDGLDLLFKRRRLTVEDVDQAISADKRFAVVYICGVPKMTDDFVENLTSPKGLALEPHRVLYEKWW